MERVKLGELLKGGEKRDAVHIAIEPAIATQELRPGEFVGAKKRGEDTYIFTGGATVGFVDPLLKKNVKKGERCYLWMFPETITSLRHDWTHPLL